MSLAQSLIGEDAAAYPDPGREAGGMAVTVPATMMALRAHARGGAEQLVFEQARTETTRVSPRLSSRRWDRYPYPSQVPRGFAVWLPGCRLGGTLRALA
jgi:hypothetical protein